MKKRKKEIFGAIVIPIGDDQETSDLLTRNGIDPAGILEDRDPDAPPPEVSFGSAKERQKAVQDFIAWIHLTTGKKITRKEIWRKRTLPNGKVGGYRNAGEFNAWQRGENRTKPSVKYFQDVLSRKIAIEF